MAKRKIIAIRIPADQIDFFGAILNCAIRYCIGRRTYMPGLVTDWIMQHCDGFLTKKTIGVMERDIDEAAAHDNLGDGCDIRTWVAFREWLKGQEDNPWNG